MTETERSGTQRQTDRGRPLSRGHKETETEGERGACGGRKWVGVGREEEGNEGTEGIQNRNSPYFNFIFQYNR